MMDINYILNGKKSKKKKQSKGIAGLMIQMPRKPIMKTRKQPIGLGVMTRSQKRVPKKSWFGDWDKDGVINRLDCAPRNKKKHAYINPMSAKDKPANYIERRFQDEDNYPKKVRVYHGTTDKHLDRIKREGIQPVSKTGVRNYHYDPEYRKNVYVSQNKSTAHFIASQNLQDGNPVVIEADIPFNQYKQGLKNYKKRFHNDRFVKGDDGDELVLDEVPPEQIKRVKPYSAAVVEKEYRTSPTMQPASANESEQRNAERKYRETFNKPLQEVEDTIENDGH